MIKLLDTTVNIADKDILCYVVLENGNIENPWNIEIDKITTIANGKYAYIGYHASEFYDELKMVEDFIGYNDRNEIKREIYEAKIPKGTKYYRGIKGFSFAITKEYLNIPYFCAEKIIISKKMLI